MCVFKQKAYATLLVVSAAGRQLAVVAAPLVLVARMDCRQQQAAEAPVREINYY